MNLFKDQDRIELLKKLKKNAPQIYVLHTAKKIFALKSQLNKLLWQYEQCENEDEKIALRGEAEAIEEELSIYS